MLDVRHIKPICRNCHFLSKEHRDNADQVFTFSLTKLEREKGVKAPDEIIASHYSLNCKMGVWDEGVSETIQYRNSSINLTKRDSNCFFFPHHPAMLFDAARELENVITNTENLNGQTFILE